MLGSWEQVGTSVQSLFLAALPSFNDSLSQVLWNVSPCKVATDISTRTSTFPTQHNQGWAQHLPLTPTWSDSWKPSSSGSNIHPEFLRIIPTSSLPNHVYTQLIVVKRLLCASALCWGFHTHECTSLILSALDIYNNLGSWRRSSLTKITLLVGRGLGFKPLTSDLKILSLLS